MLVVPENKCLRALADVIKLAAGTPTIFSDYRKITSFLHYLKPFVAGADGSYFYGLLYEPYYSRGRDGASDTITLTPQIRSQDDRWVHLLRSTAGMSASDVLHSQSPAAAAPTLHLYSDAALEGAAVPGLGGYMYGFYWAVALHGDELRLPISVLELVAIDINLVVFEELERGAQCILCSDSQKSVQVLTNLRAKSPLMAHVHFRILQLPQARSLGGATAAVHCFGPANPAADAVSQGNMDYFLALSSQLGVVSVLREDSSKHEA